MKQFPELRFVSVFFPPQNTTSRIQPMEAEVIASMTVRYRRMQIERAVDMVDKCDGITCRRIYKVDVLTAMQALRRIWHDLLEITLANCWKHTKLSLATAHITPLHIPQKQDSLERTALQEKIYEQVAVRARMSIENFIDGRGRQKMRREISPRACPFW